MNTEQETVFSVSELTKEIKGILEENLPAVMVEGEIANYTRHRSGHIYFSLKDEKSSLRCVYFKFYNQYLSFEPQEGDKVVCAGRITVFERSGNYQLSVNRMYHSGLGDLQLRFEKLKEKLSKEGMFDEEHKKPIPKFPESIGVITSSTGAAIQDIRSVLTRRYPCRIFLYPAVVQGDRAAQDIITGIEYFNRRHPVDVLIVGRGGGSQEDLFCFNDEDLARAVFNSKIPIISAVGHEIDFTIIDFVADLRAPTPSAAAELAVPNKQDLLSNLREIKRKLELHTGGIISKHRIKLQNLQAMLQPYHPKNMFLSYHQRIDEAEMKMNHYLQNLLTKKKNEVSLLALSLRELSPFEAMKRGYSIITQERRVVHSVLELDQKKDLEVLLRDGHCNCRILDVVNNEED
jgi:exodeoxyribonuclease VII large subunit